MILTSDPNYEPGFALVRANARAKRAAARKTLLLATRVERNRCAEANIRTRRIGKRGEPDRNILLDETVGGFQHRYHATKGWRVNRLAYA